MRDLRPEVRDVLRIHARIPNGIDSLSDDADLFEAGMSSHASVNVMLALEDAFDIEFPDSMLKRSVFESVTAIAVGDRRARGSGGMTITVGQGPGRSSTRSGGIAKDDRRAATPTEVDRDARFPREAVDALRDAARTVGAGAGRDRWLGGVSLERHRARLLRARSPLLGHRDGVRDAPDPGRHDRPPPRRCAVVRDLSARIWRASSG